jgi:hypothetical protein
MTTLAEELKKPEYRFGTYAERLVLVKSKTQDVVGSIRGDNLRNVVDILAKGLQDRLDKMVLPEDAEPVRTALIVVFRYLNLDDYQINLSLPENARLLQAAVDVGLVTTAESNKFFELATYKKHLYPEATVRDIVQVYEPGRVVVGDWIVIEQVPTHRLMLQLTMDAPEETNVRIEMRESHNGTDWTDWKRVAHFYSVQKAGVYYQQIPFNGLQRQVRVRGETYRLDGTVTVV